MRSHEQACELMAARAKAAAGFLGEEDNERIVGDPELIVRAMLGDLVPLEELDGLLDGIASSTVNLMGALAKLADDDELSETEAMKGQAGSIFVAIGQEQTYALLMAGAGQEPAPRITPDRPTHGGCPSVEPPA